MAIRARVWYVVTVNGRAPRQQKGVNSSMLTGSLQIKNNKYYAVLNIKVDGKRKPKWIPLGLSVRGNKRQAEALLNRLIAEYEANGNGKAYPALNESGALMTPQEATDEAGVLFADYVQSWLKMIQPSVSIATHNSYRNMVNARIDGYFREKGLTLGELTPTHLQEFYQKILDDGCTTNTVIHYHAVLHRALLNAVKKDIILRNPADRVDKPRKNRYEAAHYTEEEMRLLFDAAAGDPLELPIQIAAYYGLRRSEVLGLRWSAINFGEKTLSIRHKVIETTEGGTSHVRGEDVLKTKASVRTLPLLPVVEELLLREKAKQETNRRLFRSAYSKDWLDYVCVDEMGKLLRPNYVTEHFEWLIKKYGLRKIRFHDLRHTTASLLLANGVPMKQIQVWLGHSNFSTTADIYAHLDVSAQQATGLVAANLYERRGVPSDRKGASE